MAVETVAPKEKTIAPDPPAVLLGGTLTALSVARSLTTAGIPVYVLDRRDSPARVSRHRKVFVDVGREDMQSRMLDWLRSDQAPRGAVVLACSDEGLELIARHRAELVEFGYVPMEADDEVLLAMLDKERTYALAAEHGIAAPRVMALRDRTDLEAASREFSFPCVLKPVHSHVFARQTGSKEKVLKVGSPDELQSVFERMSAAGVEMLVTEVIAGPDDEYVSYYGYLDEHGAPLLGLTKCKIRQYPIRFGIGTYHATTRDPEVAEAGLRFLQAVGLRGLANVEFKRDGSDGRLKLIECNARFTMPNDLIRIAGIDLALFSYNRLLGRPTPAVDSYREGVRLWEPINDTRAFLEYRRRGELSPGRWIGSLLHRQHLPRARVADPLPALERVSRGLRPASRSAARRSPSVLRSPWAGGLGMLTERIARTGPRSFPLASRVDLVRSTGPGYVWRRLRAERRFSGLGADVRDATYERIWREAADAAGARMERLAPGLLELSRDGVATRVFQQTVELDDPVTLRVALDKVLVHRMMAAAGIPIPDYREFDARDPAPALEFLARASGPCVVKPAAGTGGGHGTTANVTRPDQLMRARLHAAKGGGRLLIERQAVGPVYRLLFLDGELLDVLRSVPAHLTGDGRSTVEELIAAENERRVAAEGAAGLTLVGVDLDTMFALARAGLKLSSVLEAGRTVPIGVVTNSNAAEDNETFRGEISAQIVAEARSAQAAVGLRLAGVDVIATDPVRPLAETGGVINEVNGTPGLHHHYLVADPDKATRVAIPVLERLLSRDPGEGAGARRSLRALASRRLSA